MFYSDIYLIIPSLIYYFSPLTLITTYKIFVFIIIFFTVFTTQYYVYQLTKNLYSAILASIVFVFSNYYLTDLYVRSALGELMALAIFPSLIYYIYLYIYKNKDCWIKLAILFSMLIFAHNISFFLAILLFLILLLLNINVMCFKIKSYSLIKAVLLGIGLSSWFLLPMMEQILVQDLNIKHIDHQLFYNTALSIKDLFYDFTSQKYFSLTNEVFLTKIDEVKTIGIFILLLPLLCFIDKNKISLHIKHFIFVGYLFVFLSLKYFSINYFSIIQFPSRFFLITIPLFSFVIGTISFNQKIMRVITFFVFCVLFINSLFLQLIIMDKNKVYIIPESATINELFIQRKFAKVETQYITQHREEVMNGEYLPYQIEINYAKNDDCIMYLDYSCAYYDYERNGSNLKIKTLLTEDTILLFPLSWYRGYSGKNLTTGEIIRVFPEKYSRLVSIKAKAGNYVYEVGYKNTGIQKISLIISMFSVFFIILKKN